MYGYLCGGRPPRPAVRACSVHGWTSGVGACRGSGHCWAQSDRGAHARAGRYRALQSVASQHRLTSER